jgi:hypothetical protein
MNLTRRTLMLVALAVLMPACAGDPLRRETSEFPAPVPKGAPDGIHVTRRGYLFWHNGTILVFEF